MALFTAVADIVGVTVDVAPILHGHNCGFPGLVLGEGSVPRSMVGADTITVELSFNSGPVFGDGTMTLTPASTDRRSWTLAARAAGAVQTGMYALSLFAWMFLTLAVAGSLSR